MFIVHSTTCMLYIVHVHVSTCMRGRAILQEAVENTTGPYSLITHVSLSHLSSLLAFSHHSSHSLCSPELCESSSCGCAHLCSCKLCLHLLHYLRVSRTIITKGPCCCLPLACQWVAACYKYSVYACTRTYTSVYGGVGFFHAHVFVDAFSFLSLSLSLSPAHAFFFLLVRICAQ